MEKVIFDYVVSVAGYPVSEQEAQEFIEALLECYPDDEFLDKYRDEGGLQNGSF